MKKIFIAIALFASIAVSASAQQSVKSAAAAKKAVEKSLAATENPKQNIKAATWVSLGKAYMDAYNSPFGAGWIGASRADLAIILGEDKPSSEEYVEVGGQQMIKATFATRDYYYNANEVLQMIIVTAPLYENCLENALEAYKKGYELDVKGQKKKDITAGIQTIAAKFVDEAYNAYTFGDLEKASYYFEQAAEASATEPYAIVDTNSVYNAGLTAYMLGNYDKAKTFFQKSVDLGYFGEDGDAYAKLADIADKEGNQELRQSLLEEAFTKFPQSQGVLVGLINFYISSGKDTDRLFELIAAAKANEPTNASLYYVEGNIHLQLNQETEALEAYRQCAVINPDYEFGYIGEGQYWYNKAVDIQEKASNEMNDKKYMELVDQFETALKSCIAPFEMAYETSKDETIKVAVCEYLKNACFRFRNESKEYQAKYDKYNEIVNSARQ